MRRHRPSTAARSLGRSAGQPAGQAAAWSRDKLLALLAGGALAVLLLAAGLVLAVVSMLRADRATPERAATDRAGSPNSMGAAGTGTAGAPAPDRLAGAPDDPDALAAAPMPAVPASASHPSAVSLAAPPAPLLLPRPTGTGPAGVPTGFGRTPQGAVAQLAAIDASALSSADLGQVRAVITGWALPGGPTASSWSGARAVARLLDATATSGGGVGQLAVAANPLMGLVKGSLPRADGSSGGARPDFVVACVDLEVDVTLTATARGAVADCQRMVWSAGRWRIGPGAEPAAAPSVWPGTDLAYRVGYRDLRPAAAMTSSTSSTGGTAAGTTNSRNQVGGGGRG